MRGRLVYAVLILAVVAEGCAGKTRATGPVGELASGDVRVEEAPSATPAQDGDITVDETQWVVDALDRARADMVRAMVAAGRPTPETQAYLEAFFDEPFASVLEATLGRAAARRFTGVAVPLDRAHSTVREVRFAGECVRALVDRDLSSMVITLRRSRPGRDSEGLNPTGWSIVDEQVVDMPVERPVEDPCDASSA